MSADLVTRLRSTTKRMALECSVPNFDLWNDHSNACLEAAASLAAKDDEIADLHDQLADKADEIKNIEGHYANVCRSCASAESRAEQAERAYRDLTSYIEGWTSPGELKLRAGEMTAQEVRTVQAVLSAILDKARTAAFVAQHGSDSREGE